MIWNKITTNKSSVRNFPGGLVVKNLPSSAEDMGSVPGKGTKVLQE